MELNVSPLTSEKDRQTEHALWIDYYPIGGKKRRAGPFTIRFTEQLKEALLAHSDDPRSYGRLLTEQLFANKEAHQALCNIRLMIGAKGPFCVEIRLREDDRDAQSLRWETLIDPIINEPLALDENVRMWRAVNADHTPTGPHHLQQRALIAIANPTPGGYPISQLSNPGEKARELLEVLSMLSPTRLVRTEGEASPTRLRLLQAMRSYSLIFLAAHGGLDQEGPCIFLENEDGGVDPVRVMDFAEAVRSMASVRVVQPGRS
jgi:hypothetical protein